MTFFSPDPTLSKEQAALKLAKRLGDKALIEALEQMLLIRNFELRGEAAYQQGLVGGFYHSYTGQEAIQTACVAAFGQNHWYTGFYRCHALALLLGATPEELMAELYGKATGNAKGRGGSMHLYADRLLGGFAIVGGHLPIACGAAFSLKYQGKKDQLSLCFMGEGAVAQGAFHESLNLAALWDLPVVFIIENNQWGMGTHVSRSICTETIADRQAESYGMKSYLVNGMDWFESYLAFEHIYREVLETSRPVLVECVCERFRGHSISDPGLYRTKEALEAAKAKDPILSLKSDLIAQKLIDEKQFKELDKKQREVMISAMEFAQKSPAPATTSLEEDVYAP